MGFFDGMDTSSFSEEAPVVKPITPAKEIKNTGYDPNEVEDDDYAPEPEDFFDEDNSDVEDRRVAFEKADKEAEYDFDDLEEDDDAEGEEDEVEDMPYGDEEIPEGALPKVKMPAKEEPKKEEAKKEEPPVPAKKPEPRRESFSKEDDFSGATRISRDTTVTGSISSPSARIVIEGKVSGDISAAEVTVKEDGAVEGTVFAKKLTIIGGDVGEIKVGSLVLEKGKISHGVEVEEILVVKKDTVITGHVSSASAEIRGKIKGDIDSTGTVYLYDTAVVKGNISALDVILHDGSKLQGSITKTSEIDDSEFE